MEFVVSDPLSAMSFCAVQISAVESHQNSGFL